MKVLELTITILYFLVCAGIAVYFRRSTKGGVSFWGADRNIGFFVNGVAVLSTLVSAASFLGFLGLSYRMGWSFTTMSFGVGSALGFILSLLLVSGPLRRYSELRGKYTLTNFFYDRYGKSSGLFATIFVLILYPAYIVPQLMGSGLVGAYLLGIDFTSAVLLVGVVYVLYVLLGGMLSVTWTDFLQGILLFTMMVALSFIAANHFGGFGPTIAEAVKVNPYFLSINPNISPLTYIGISLGVLTFTLASPHIIMRLFTAKNVTQGRAALSLTAALTLIFHLVGYLGVAGAALILFPKLANIDNTYIEVMNQFFPPVVRGLAAAAILAAIMSTTAGMLLTIGAEVSGNLYKRYWRADAEDRRVIVVGQLAMLLVGILTTILALVQTQSIGVIVGLLVEGVGSALVVPLIAGLWWPRANHVGGFLSAFGGFAVFFIVHFWVPVPMFAEILFALPASVIFMVVGSLATAPARDKHSELVDELHRAVRLA